MNEFCEVKRPVIVARDAAVWNQTNAEFASEKRGDAGFSDQTGQLKLPSRDSERAHGQPWLKILSMVNLL